MHIVSTIDMTDDIPFLSPLFTFLRDVQVFNLIMLSVIPIVNITVILRSFQHENLTSSNGLGWWQGNEPCREESLPKRK